MVKKPKGIESLKPEPVSIEEIKMIDWYAAFALLSMPVNLDASKRAQSAFDIAQAMMKERNERI